MQRFVIISHPRSGCHLLRGYLCSHPEIHCLDEQFNRWTIDPVPPQKRGAHKCDDVLREAWSSKMPWIRGLIVHSGCFTELPFWKVLLNSPDVKIIRTMRSNLLRSAISLYIGRKTNRYHNLVAAAERPTERTIELRPKSLAFIKSFIDKTEMRTESIEQFYGASHEIHSVVYEEICADTPRIMMGVLNFLGAAVLPVFASTRKLERRRLEEIVTNYNWLRAELRGTRYERHLLNEDAERNTREAALAVS